MDTPEYTQELWKTIPIAPAYDISSQGRVRRNTPDGHGSNQWRILRPFVNDSGYEVHTLYVDGRRIKKAAHVLTCITFNGPSPHPGYQVAHKDGQKRKNTPDNLYWATVKQNAEDRVRHGTQVRGERHWSRTNPEKVKRGEDWKRAHSR